MVTAAAAAAALVGARATSGATYVYDPAQSATSGTDGNGAWDTTTSNWFNAATGATANPQVWSNSPADTALFGSGGTAGTVAVSSVTAGAIQFNSASGGYILNGGTITLGGAGVSTIQFQTSSSVGITPTINSVITGATGVNTSNAVNNLTSTAVLTLGGLNTYTGATYIGGNVTLSVSNISNGLAASGIGQSSNASGNLVVFGSAGLANTVGAPESGATLLYTGGSQQTDRGITFGGAVQDNVNVSSPSAVLTFGGQVVGLSSNNYRWVKQGPGTLAFTFAGTNTFTTGNSAGVDNGTLVLGATGQIDNFATLLVIGNAVSPAGTASAPNSPVLNIIGGTVNIPAGLQFGNNDLAVNQLLTSNITGGTLVTPSITFTESGPSTTGFLNVSNGAAVNLTTTGGAYVGAAKAGNSSVLTLSGTGTTITAFGIGTGGTSYVTQQGTGTVNQSGGAFTLAGTLNVGGTIAAAVGTYNLSGGTLTAQVIAPGTGTSTFNFNGGTLQAANNSTGFMAGLTAANVQAGGATIDTQAFNVSVGQKLLSGVANDGGLTKIGGGTLTLTGTNAYVGNTAVSLGTLRVNGSTLSSGTVLVPTGGTLGGNGSVGAVTVAGTITAGPDGVTAANLSTGAETWNASGGYTVKVAGGAVGGAVPNDRLLLLSGLTVGATPGSPFAVLPANVAGVNVGATFVIATAAGTSDPFAPYLASEGGSGAIALSLNTPAPATGTFTLVSGADPAGGYDLLLQDVTAAPEPTSLLLATLAAAPTCLARRRRRRA